VLGEQPRRPPRRDMNSRRFIIKFHPPPRRISGSSRLKTNIFAGAVQQEPGGRPLAGRHKIEKVPERINDVCWVGNPDGNMLAASPSAFDPAAVSDPTICPTVMR